MRNFLKFVLFVCIVVTPRLAFAYTEIIGLLVDDGINSLSRGGMERLPEERDHLDFQSPLFLDSKGKYRLDTAYEHQRTVRVFNGSWAGSHAYAEHLESAIAAPFSLWHGNIAGNVAAGYGYRSIDVKAASAKEDVFVAVDEKFNAVKGGLFLKLRDNASLGLAVVDTDYRSAPEIPLTLEISPLESVKAGYKRSYIDFAGDFAVRLSGNDGTVPLHYKENVDELYVSWQYNGVFYAKYANELKRPDNRSITAKLALPASLYLVGNYARHDFDFNQDFLVAATPGGYLKGTAAWQQYRIGLGAQLGERWTVEANYRRGDLAANGGGVANSSAVVNFWPSLIVGNYNHTFNAELESKQYHLGTEYQGENFSMGFGCQYLDLRPVAQLDYWRSLLFGLGKTGAGSLKLSTDRIQMLFFSFGVGYKWEHLSVGYAFGQFIPIATHDANEKPAQTAPGGSGNEGGSSNIFSSIADKINYNPGGNIQRLIFTLTF